MANMEVLVVAGGGGGGGYYYSGGGGGAGGHQYNANFTVAAGSYNITIGNGGIGTVKDTSISQNGENSVFSTITALGGGRGGDENTGSGGNGGSGGGGRALGDPRTGGTGSQGYNGGTGASGATGAGGGGGAGAVGTNGAGDVGGAGGAGTSIYSALLTEAEAGVDVGGTRYICGGGAPDGWGGNGGGGIGGGGAGRSNGTANTGGGGGGCHYNGPTGPCGTGGSGLVIVKYLTSDFGVCTGGTKIVSGNYTIHKFTSSETFYVFSNTTKTSTAKASIQKSFTQTSTSKARIQKNVPQTLTAKASITGCNIKAKASIKANILQTINAKTNLVNNVLLTITAKSRITSTKIVSISAQACLRNEVYETVRQVAPKIEIQWDGVTWTDESIYFLSAQGNEQLAGVDGEGIASTLDVELDNTDDRFTPNNVDSTLYGYIKPRVPIRIETIIGTSFRLFTGYIKNFHPDIKSKICSLECYDNQVLLNNKEANGIVYEDNRTDELLTVLATLAELDPAQYTFEVGLHIVNFGYFENRNVWPVMGELAIAERGRIFFDRYGTLTFWNRDHLHNQTSIITLTQNDWILDLDYSIAEHDIKNYITVQAKPRASAGIQVVWSNGDVQYLDAYSDTLILIPANGSQSAWLELEDPCSTFIPPVSGTDFIANSEQDSSGVDLTSNIFVNQFIEYGDSVYVNVVNTGDTDAYLVKFQVRGNPAQVLNYIQVNVQDTTSISLYGKQDETIQNNFIQDEGSATEIAYEELWRRQDAVNNFDINIVGIPYLLCGDLVSVEYIKGSYDNYLIEQISWTLDSGGFKEKLRLTTPYIFPTIQRIDAKAMIVGGHFIKTVTSKGNIT